jgi:hypothetical protein
MESAVPMWENMTPAEERKLLSPVSTSVQVPPAVLFADTSPLHAMPGNLHIAQMVVLDGISTSIDAISIAYRSLQAGLLEFNRAMDQHRPPSRTLTVPAVMNAWTVIDAAYRLRLLVPTLRGLKHGPAVMSLLKSLAPVESFRHVVQHLDQQIPRLLEDCQPVWGSLSWAYVDGAQASTIRIGLLMPGAARAPMELPLVNPLGKRIEIPIGLVTLSAAGETVCLSDIVSAVRLFAGRLERAVAAAFSSLPDTLGAQAGFDLPID